MQITYIYYASRYQKIGGDLYFLVENSWLIAFKSTNFLTDYLAQLNINYYFAQRHYAA